MTVHDLKHTYQYGTHGLGAYRGLRQTNTREAFDYWYQKGIRVFEIDMAHTMDDGYVAVAHGMDNVSLGRLEIALLPEQRTYGWFMGQKLFAVSTKGLTPLSLADIVELLVQHPDAVVMLDLFGMFAQEQAAHFTRTLAEIIGSRTALWERLLLEAYDLNMARGIQSAQPRANVIYCVRYEENVSQPTTLSPEELMGEGIRFASYPWYCTQLHPGEIETYAAAGMTVFSRTKFNTKDKALRSAGVHVNLIAKRFDGARIVYQWPLYMATYFKRIAVKLYLRFVRRA